MVKKLINRPQPFPEESLTSYLQRIAQNNYIPPHELWRWFMVEGAHYPQSSIAKVIDYVPGNILDLKKMSCSLDIEIEKIISLTFQVVLKKFYSKYTTDSEFAASRILIGMIDSTRKFCLKCLRDFSYYKLIWQVKEINHCQKHNVRLLSQCPNCQRKISLFSVKSRVGFCGSL